MADGLSWDVFTLCGVDVDVMPVLNTDIVWLTGVGQRRFKGNCSDTYSERGAWNSYSVVLGYLLSQLQSVDALSVLQVSLCADYMFVVVCFVFAELNSH